MNHPLDELDGRKLSFRGKLIRTARFEDEWYGDVPNPEALIQATRNSNCCADVLDFWQLLPEVEHK